MTLTETPPCHVVALVDLWRYGCPKSPGWDCDVDLGTEGEESSADTSSDEKYEEHNVGNLSLEVFGQGWSGWLVHPFLED